MPKLSRFKLPDLAHKILPLFIVCLLIFTGCTDVKSRKNAVNVNIEGSEQFPDYLVGTWKTDLNDWEISFKPDGTIEYAVISLGRVKIKPGQDTIVPMVSGGKGTFKPGQWSVQYFQDQHQLIVEIVIDSFHVEVGDNIVYGKTKEFFSGIIPENSDTWRAERYAYPEYYVNTDKYKNYLLPDDPNENPREILLFKKVH
jgi:hypothetical protein